MTLADLCRDARHAFQIQVAALQQSDIHINQIFGLTQQPTQLVQVAGISFDDELALVCKRFGNRFRTNIRITVHVATHPSGESDHPRQFRTDAEFALETVQQYLMEYRQDAVDRLEQIVRHMVALVTDTGFHR